MKFNPIFFLYACLIYSVTLVNVPPAPIYILISAIGFYHLLIDFRRKNILKFDYFLLLFLLISIGVYFFGTGIRENTAGKSANDYIPYTVFLVCTIFFSRHLNKKIFEYILFFIILEVIIGIVEYSFGVPYLFKPTALGETQFGATDLFYYNKVYGLSAVTSIFAQKIFTAVLLVYFLNIKKFRYLILGLLSIGLLITFNRTSIVSTVIFFIALGFPKIKKLKLKYILLSLLTVIILGVIFYEYLDLIMFQFFRGGGEIDYSDRDMVFPAYLDFIENNLLFGNFVDRVWIELMPGRIFHAHNSYLETISSLGIILSTMLFVYLYKVIHKSKLIYIIPILAYSFYQFGILWGVSYLDILFFTIIFHTPEKIKNTSLNQYNKRPSPQLRKS